MFCQALGSVPIGHTECPVFPLHLLEHNWVKNNSEEKLFLPRLVISIVAGINNFIAASEGQQMAL